jgi:hypothetical protein
MMDCRAAVRAAVLLAIAALAAAAPARADNGPVIVIPSRPGIPVVINGVDASYAVVEGDWGLSRPGHGRVTVIGGAPLVPNHVYHRRNSYHPRYGRPPARGRHEIEPAADRALPEPAESFTRSWSTSSDLPPPRPLYDPVPQVRGEPYGASEPETPPPQARAQTFQPPGIDAVPPTINDPQPFNPPVVVVPRNRRP